ncbi:MAG: hypothetical protein DRO99_02025 [Candidatus Aenigmatarchaeota archaeon]|nr:MAG: hypothetical protein DRO99_02025 [Candidatus Aenigmarchaeota archaeon]
MDITVCIFHDSGLAQELGEPISGEGLCEMKLEGNRFLLKTITRKGPLPLMDAAIISFADMNDDVRETIKKLDSAGITKGIAIIPRNTPLNDITSATEGTVLESFVVKNRDIPVIRESLGKIAASCEGEHAPTRKV